MKHFKLFLSISITLIFACQITLIAADAVCTEAMLITALVQDIKDNKKLDCLRVPLPPPTDIIETDNDRRLRIEAAWDTDCAFEAAYDWLKNLKSAFGLKTGLVNSDGRPVDHDFDDQADMCEIVRAIIAGGLIEGAKLDDLSPSAVDGIDCPGDDTQGQSEICAVTGGAPGQQYSWYIFLEGITITTDNKPSWDLDPASKKLLDAKK